MTKIELPTREEIQRAYQIIPLPSTQFDAFWECENEALSAIGPQPGIVWLILGLQIAANRGCEQCKQQRRYDDAAGEAAGL